MALYYDLQVYKDVYAFIRKLFEYTKDFPHEYKYSLGQDIKRDSLCLVRNLYRANKAQEKVPHLENFMDDFELLKMELRLSGDLKLLPLKRQAELAFLMESIGKQITGWRNANR